MEIDPGNKTKQEAASIRWTKEVEHQLYWNDHLPPMKKSLKELEIVISSQLPLIATMSLKRIAKAQEHIPPPYSYSHGEPMKERRRIDTRRIISKSANYAKTNFFQQIVTYGSDYLNELIILSKHTVLVFPF